MPGDGLAHGPPASKKRRRQIPQVQPNQSGIPCAMVLQLIRDLPGDRAVLPPSRARPSRALDLSVGRPGPHDFAVRVVPPVKPHRRVHRIPSPTSVTVAKRPSIRAGNKTGT
jgi:hypothetical protein